LEIYEGLKTVGAPEYVISNGEVVVENGKLISNQKGRFLKRHI
jgi:dihydropyrimidinase